MTIVLDTNVLISGIFFAGPPGRILDVLTATCEICLAIPLPEQVCSDASDDKFLACALSAGVSTVVSGDKGLLAVSGFQGIEVVKPKVFVEKHLENEE